MVRVQSAANNETADLTCPITLELFRDPVIAGDGHVYEREAITSWIREHGTSRLTREPLQINQLRSDDNLRRLAEQRRNATVAYNARDSVVTLPPLRTVPGATATVTPTPIASVPTASNPAETNCLLRCINMICTVLGESADVLFAEDSPQTIRRVVTSASDSSWSSGSSD